MLLENKSEKMKSLYFRLKNSVLSEFGDVDVKILVDAFSFKVANSLICVVTFLKSSFSIYIYGSEFENADELTDISQISTGGNANYQMKYTSDDDLDCFMNLFKETYNQRKIEND